MQDLEFPRGLCAFETYTRFRLIHSAHYAELWFLESKEDPDLSFPMVPVALLDSNYQLLVSDEDRALLQVEETDEMLCFAIVTAYEDSPPTANLLAPVVANPHNGRAVQAVRADGIYSHKHPLAPEVPCS